MKVLKSKMAIFLALLLIGTISASTMLTPTANAHTPPWTIPTYAFINAAPDPVGVGQKINVIMWIDKIPDGAAVGNDHRWHNYKLTVTKPNGQTETTTFPVEEDTTSAQFYSYTPDTVGEYTFTFDFPGQVFDFADFITDFMNPFPHQSAYVNDTYLPSSATTTVTVQQDPITAISSYPLPTDYWTRPIYAENTDWWSISSNWLGTSSPWFTTENSYTSKYIPGAVGPQTSHIMWTKPLQSGGVVGGTDYLVPGVDFFEGSAYINRFTNPIIMDGMLYYNPPLSFSTGSTTPTICVDLQSGELIWSRSDVTAPSFGIMPNVPPNDPNQHGVFPPMLVTVSGGFNFFTGSFLPTTWIIYDADTGNWIMNVTNVPAGSPAMGPDGEYLIYSLTNKGSPTTPNYYVSEWNFTRMIYTSAGFLSPTTVGYTYDGSSVANYDWNVSASGLNALTGSPTQVVAYYNDVLLGYTGTLPSGGSPAAFGRYSEAPYTYFAVSLDGTHGAGSMLWSNTLQPPAGNVTVFWAGADPVSRVFVESHKETSQWVAYSLDTGNKMWGPTGDEKALDYYGNDFGGVPCAQLAYGNLYYSGFGGVIYCYDSQTGALKWTYGNGGEGNTTNSGLYTGYGVYPTFITAIGNGVIYTETTEHTILNPIYKGALARAVNATDGTEIWTLSDYTGGGGSTTSYAIADGYATFFNGYDNQIYVVGRGPSTLTVDTPKAAITLGSSLIVSGTVTDVSSGTEQKQQKANFANGVPLSSDESMKDWMGHVYQQKPLPTNFKGVDVKLDVIDSNGNYRNIGTATTDATGIFSYQWMPDIEGMYTVIATFEGTNGYWPSYSETSFAVDPANPTQAPTQPPQTNLATTTDLMMYMAIGVVAIIIAIAIVGLLLLRKRP
jgi:hypothetical protein